MGIAGILVERIASGVAAIERLNFLRIFLVKDFLFGDALARSRPHVSYVDVLLAVVVEIAPTSAHSSARIVYRSRIGDCFEGSVAAIAVEIAAAKIVGDVEVGPAVRIEVSPGAGKAEAIVFNVQA